MQNTITITVKETKTFKTSKEVSLPAFFKSDSGNYRIAVYSKERCLTIGSFSNIESYSIHAERLTDSLLSDTTTITEAEFMQAFKIAEKKITDSLSVLNMAISYANKTEDQEKQELRLEAQIGDAIESLEIEEVSND